MALRGRLRGPHLEIATSDEARELFSLKGCADGVAF
jgi:hypothetical protein